MDKEFRTRIEGELSIARWRTRLKAGVENIKNYTYFNQQAMPEQKSGSIQVLSASLNQDFKLGIFHLDNEVTRQKSSDQTVLPLPDLSLYHNFYMQFKLAKKVLSVQLGADVRYFSKYNAPAYMPAIQNFYLQPENDRRDRRLSDRECIRKLTPKAYTFLCNDVSRESRYEQPELLLVSSLPYQPACTEIRSFMEFL